MTDVTDSLLGEHWTRASNVVVRKKTEEVKEEYSPHSDVDLAGFQLQLPVERRKSRRISSLREKSELDIQQLRRASQKMSQSAFPRSPESARKAGRKSKERIDASGLKEVRGAKIANMLRECLQIANFRLLETAREVSEKISASLQNTGMPSVWPADVVPLHSAPFVSSLDLESFVPSKRGVTHALPVQWFQVKLVKVHAFNERLERRRFKSSISNHNDPEILHLAFQDSLEEARRIQAQAVTAKNEVQRLARAVALQRAKLRAAPASAPSVPRSPKTKGVTLPTIIVNASG